MPLGSPRSDCRGRKGMLFSGTSTMPVLLSTSKPSLCSLEDQQEEEAHRW